MDLIYSPPHTQRRIASLGLMLAIHLALILAWQYARQLPQDDMGDPERILLWQVVPRPRVEPRMPAPLPPLQRAPVAKPAASAPAPAAQAPAPAPVVEVPVEAAPPAPQPSAQELIQAAKRSLGKIDKELREAYPAQPITAPVSNGRTRLAEGLQNAADAAPNKWYEAPKVTEIIDPGPYSRRRYRVVTANKTYCITVESNHAPDGLDTMKNGIQQKTTNCEPNEVAAKKQDWSKPIGYQKPGR